jgi:hypothetical protein
MTPGANGGAQASTFKSSREDDLLKKLDMYEQKYQLKGSPSRTPQVRRTFDSVQLTNGRVPQSNDFMVPQRRNFGYSTNNSPNKEPTSNNRLRAEGNLHKNWNPSLELGF